MHLRLKINIQQYMNMGSLGNFLGDSPCLYGYIPMYTCNKTCSFKNAFRKASPQMVLRARNIICNRRR